MSHTSTKAQRRGRRTSTTLVALGLGLTLGACSLGGSTPGEDAAESAPSGAVPSAGQSPAASGPVVVATHDSWALPKKLLARFEEQTGHQVEIQQAGDAGALTNKLVLTKGSPIADVAYGVDNTFASRAVSEGVFVDHEPADQPASADELELPDEAGAAALTPVDYGDVCVNVDDAWFRTKGIEPPRTLADLTEKTYEDLLVTPGATTSSPGLAFLLATVAEYGEDGWQQYWEELMANGARVTSGWTDAYTVDFTAGGGGGDRPIVVSYASSPPFTIPEGKRRPTTSALLDTCYRQVEYAGVLAGASNPEGAKAFVDFLQSPEVQAALPDSMYVFPVDDSVELPEVWARWAKTPQDPLLVDAATVADRRDDWLTAWGEITTR